MSLNTELPAEKQFYVNNGPVLESADALLDALENNLISDESFQFHLERKDFAKWIDGSIGDAQLAKSLNKIKTKKSYIKKLKEA